MRRSLSVLVSALLVLGMSWTSLAADPEGEFFSKINEERAQTGLSTLSADQSLLEVARRHSARMAEAGRIFHNDNLPNEVDGWVLLGENVGRGSNTQSIHDAFMASPNHRAQILEGRYERGAVGVVESEGSIWVTELFIKRSVATAEPAAATSIRKTPSKANRPKLASRETKSVDPPSDPVVEAAVFPEEHPLVGLALAEESTIATPALALPLLNVDLTSSASPDVVTILAITMLTLVVLGHSLRRFARI